ncbi:MAG TPA: sensor domain-containing protein, partial [Steroidobacteraceae bacterium]|nr:sensor domain-containing protein [Steroidobacteraceae bacterium]
AQHKDKSESDVLELIASTYGAPEEVADAYRTTEATVRAALAPPPRPRPQSALGRFFAVFGDSRAYTSLFFMLLSLATGIIYFTVIVTGISMSAGLLILIIGIPFFLLFLGLVRVLALAEGRLVEALTGTRMPRRPASARSDSPWYQRIVEMVRDRYTWTAMFYMLLQLPLGIIYFTIAVSGLALGLGLIFGPVAELFDRPGGVDIGMSPDLPLLVLPFVVAFGILMLTLLMHLAKAIGMMHGHLAKTLLVRSTG